MSWAFLCCGVSLMVREAPPDSLRRRLGLVGCAVRTDRRTIARNRPILCRHFVLFWCHRFKVRVCLSWSDTPKADAPRPAKLCGSRTTAHDADRCLVGCAMRIDRRSIARNRPILCRHLVFFWCHRFKIRVYRAWSHTPMPLVTLNGARAAPYNSRCPSVSRRVPCAHRQAPHGPQSTDFISLSRVAFGAIGSMARVCRAWSDIPKADAFRHATRCGRRTLQPTTSSGGLVRLPVLIERRPIDRNGPILCRHFVLFLVPPVQRSVFAECGRKPRQPMPSVCAYPRF
ncbi:hypothetical protein MSL71_52300 [Desulfoluna butyratoxydans]|uniref:Uncharacterized protein n=1 Tax=Desulfoluna butyratoxydans TaxID=231438 RepID=A0A4U8YVA6_9BACT|nr:hypothetical protein MSL71_52300 [Desulfoluna butyratoxydans]